jgi:protease I
MNHKEKGATFSIDVSLDSAKSEDYDALLLPGGVANPDELRTEPKAVNFVKLMFDEGKPIAAICHGPWMLVEAAVVRNHKLTSWPSLRTDILNAGGSWIDQEVVQDGQLTTSRKPEDIPAFIDQMLLSFASTRETRALSHRQRQKASS